MVAIYETDISDIENKVVEECYDIAGNKIDNNMLGINFEELNKQCDDIMKLHETTPNEVWSKPWSEEQALDFASQFIKYADETNEIDPEKIDFRPFDPEYFRNKFPKFDEIVYDKLSEYSNKCLEDHRQAPLKKIEGEFFPFEETRQDKS